MTHLAEISTNFLSKLKSILIVWTKLKWIYVKIIMDKTTKLPKVLVWCESHSHFLLTPSHQQAEKRKSEFSEMELYCF